MKVLFVCNNAFTPGNGLSASARSTIRQLRLHGVDARLMAVRNPDPAGPQPDFPLEHFKFPIFEPIIRANGFAYAKIDRKVIEQAVEWADIVHFEEAMPLEDAVRKIAVAKGKACTATFHLYPHNITANLDMGKRSFMNDLIMRWSKRIVYNYCSDIQCPTAEVARYLREKGVRARLHVISNGLLLPEEPLQPQPVSPGNPIDILCIGRLANEKSQQTLLNAMRYSHNASRIRLHFAGNGPKGKKYQKMAKRLVEQGVLRYEPVFGFYSADQLRALAQQCYLYVHCAWVEVEGLSCLEMTREGLVPVIGEGKLIGTSSFALCPESLYPVQDSQALATRIDWWIAHPDVRNRMSQEYADAARNYDINRSTDALIAMFDEALHS
ncbi:MAG: glycosyltransferase [Bacteroidales bacterium]|nr:glycosyltransferase [Bacteroidales bacterium]